VTYGVEAFVADGLIVLKKDRREGGRYLRKLELVKMKGAPTPQTESVFTLKDGFKLFPPFKVKPVDKPQRFKPHPDVGQFFSTGSPDLDLMLGGCYPKGSAVLLEVEEHISTLQYHLLGGSNMLEFRHSWKRRNHNSLSRCRCQSYFEEV
jgi:hypothetical protein